MYNWPLICLASDNTWFSYVVRKFTNSPVDKAFVLYESPTWGGWWVGLIGEFGVQNVLADRFIPEQTFVEYWGYQQTLESGLSAMRDYRGEKYSRWKVFKSALDLWTCSKLGVEKVPRTLFSTLCGFDFCAGILKYAGVSGTENWDTPRITPREFRQFLVKHPQFFMTKNPIGTK